MPHDTSVQAEYENGFILDETELNDVSPYNSQQNVFRAILDKSPEVINGKLVRFSVFWKDSRYDIDWTKLTTQLVLFVLGMDTYIRLVRMLENQAGLVLILAISGMMKMALIKSTLRS